MADTIETGDGTWVKYIRTLKNRIDKWLALTLLFGLILAAGYGLAAGARGQPDTETGRLLGMLIALTIVGGAAAVGAIAGFLFGLPRALTSGEVRELARLNSSGAGPEGAAGASRSPGPAQSQRPADSRDGGGFGANTNLERISDWLTTIIVGIGIANIATLPEAIDRFGLRIEPFFTFGGRAFGIGGGLFFLIFGFLLSYISTRTKLMLIFTENEGDKRSVEGGALDAALTKARDQSPVPPVRPPPATTDEAGDAGAAPVRSPSGWNRPQAPPPSKSDRLVLDNLTLSTEQTPDQMLAVANASARTGDFAKAKVLYDEYRRLCPFDAKVAVNYAGVLGMNGDANGMESLRTELAVNRASWAIPEAETDFVAGLQFAVQANLYNGRYEDSLHLGEVLLARYPNAADAWTHVWLACAYGQRHRAVKTLGGEAELNARAKAVEHVRLAVEKDPGMKSYIATLYLPGEARGGDDDLVSLYEDEDLNRILDLPTRTMTMSPPTPRSRPRRK